MSMQRSRWQLAPVSLAPNDRFKSITEPMSRAGDVLSQLADVVNVAKKLIEVSSRFSSGSTNIVERLAAEVMTNLADSITTFTQPSLLYALPVAPLTGGNAGFVTAVREACHDPDDLNKPVFDRDDYVVGAVLYAGAPLAETFKLLESLNSLLKMFNIKHGSLDHYIEPVPRSFTARVIPRMAADTATANIIVSNRTYSPNHVRLSWQPAKMLRSFRIAEDATIKLRITGIEIFRAEHPITERGVGPVTLKDTVVEKSLAELKIAEPTLWGMTSLDATFVDGTVEAGKKYYYAARYKMVYSAPGEDGDEVFGPLTTTPAISVNPEEMYPSKKAAPPNWVTIDAPINVIPGAEHVSTRIQEELNSILERFAASTDWTDRKLNYIADWTSDLMSRAHYLKSAGDFFSSPQTSMSFPAPVNVFGFSGKGGTSAFLNALEDAMSSKEPGTPKFKGGDLSAGIVLLAGARNPVDVEAAKVILSMLVNETRYSDVSTAVDELDKSIDALTDLLSHSSPGGSTDAGTAVSACDPSLTERKK